MTLESYRTHCLAKREVTESLPFSPDVLVFKVAGKIFALSGVEDFDSISLKVDPEKGAELREQYPAVRPGYHLDKRRWITVMMDGSIPDKLLRQWIDTSYNLVVAGLPKKVQARLR